MAEGVVVRLVLQQCADEMKNPRFVIFVRCALDQNSINHHCCILDARCNSPHVQSVDSEPLRVQLKFSAQPTLLIFVWQALDETMYRENKPSFYF
eukprot:scaffold27037_cov137-Cylindrotheca_fusiformis.AAC.1